MSHQDISAIRRDYGQRALLEQDCPSDPLMLFKQWLTLAIVTSEELNNQQPALQVDPTAMVLATVDQQLQADTRVVLLKDIVADQLVFYSNYQSQKAQQIQLNPRVASNFYWPWLSRQVRIRGIISQLPSDIADHYFASRPRASQLAAHASAQSRSLTDRAQLMQAFQQVERQYSGEVPRPEHWGGYQIKAQEFEFWQGRDNRLHDRIHYHYQANQWHQRRLAP